MLWEPWFFSSPICHRTCLPCSLQVLCLFPFSLLFFEQAALERMDLLASHVSPYLPSFTQICLLQDEIYCLLLSLVLGLDHMPPYLPSYLSPTCLLILSTLPCFSPSLQQHRRELFSPSLSLLTCSSCLCQCLLHLSPHSLLLFSLGAFWDPRFSLSPTCV